MTTASLTHKRLATGRGKFNNRKPLGFGFGGLVLACLLCAFSTSRLAAQSDPFPSQVNYANIYGYINYSQQPQTRTVYVGETVSSNAEFYSNDPCGGFYVTWYPGDTLLQDGGYDMPNPHIESPQGTEYPSTTTSSSVDMVAGIYHVFFQAALAFSYTPTTPGSATFYAATVGNVYVYTNPPYGNRTQLLNSYSNNQTLYLAQMTINAEAGSAPNFTTQPASQTVPVGENASFTVAATMSQIISGNSWANITYQWQVSTDNGATWNNLSDGGNISGSTSATLNIAGVTGSMNGEDFLCVASDHFGSTNSAAASLRVGPGAAASIQTQPASQAIGGVGTTNVTFSVVAGGSAPFTYQWQVSTDGGATWNNLSDGGIYSGSATASLGVSATPSMIGYKYDVIVGNLYGSPVTSNAAIIALATFIQSQPVSQSIQVGPILTFSVVAGGSGSAFTYQWELTTNGGATWTTLTDGGAYSGSTTPTLTVNATPAMLGYGYAVIVSGQYGPPVKSSTANILPSSVPAMPLWALASFIALIFFGAKMTLSKKYRPI